MVQYNLNYSQKTLYIYILCTYKLYRFSTSYHNEKITTYGQY